jgi:hypothetical protein
MNPDESPSLLLCIPVEVRPNPPYRASFVTECDQCLCKVWSTPASLAKATADADIICAICFHNHFSKEVDSFDLQEEFSEGQMREFQETHGRICNKPNKDVMWRFVEGIVREKRELDLKKGKGS